MNTVYNYMTELNDEQHTHMNKIIQTMCSVENFEEWCSLLDKEDKVFIAEVVAVVAEGKCLLYDESWESVLKLFAELTLYYEFTSDDHLGDLPEVARIFVSTIYK